MIYSKKIKMAPKKAAEIKIVPKFGEKMTIVY